MRPFFARSTYMGIVLLKAFFAGGLIYWLLQRDSLDLSIIWHLANPLQLVLLLGLYLCLLLINNLRWCLFLRAFGINAAFKETLKLTFMGLFFNFAMFGGVGGDLVKGYYLIRDKKDKKLQAAISIFLDRFAGLYTMLIISLVTLLLNFNNISDHTYLMGLLLFVAVLFLGTSVFLMMLFTPWFYKIYRQILHKLPWDIWNTNHKWKSLKFSYFVKAIGFSFISLAICIVFFMVSGILMGFEVPFWIYVYAVPLGFVFMAIPISPGGIGVGQVATLALFSWGLGEETQVGPVTVSAFQLIGILWGLLGAFFYVRIRNKMKRGI